MISHLYWVIKPGGLVIVKSCTAVFWRTWPVFVALTCFYL